MKHRTLILAALTLSALSALSGCRLHLRSHAPLEPAPTVMVLVRVQAAEIQRVRTFSADCQVDAGGLQVYWLGDVNAAQSVEFLKSFYSCGCRTDAIAPCFEDCFQRHSARIIAVDEENSRHR